MLTQFGLEIAVEEALACLPDPMHPALNKRQRDGIVSAQVILAAALGDDDPGNVVLARGFAHSIQRGA